MLIFYAKDINCIRDKSKTFSDFLSNKIYVLILENRTHRERICETKYLNIYYCKTLWQRQNMTHVHGPWTTWKKTWKIYFYKKQEIMFWLLKSSWVHMCLLYLSYNLNQNFKVLRNCRCAIKDKPVRNILNIFNVNIMNFCIIEFCVNWKIILLSRIVLCLWNCHLATISIKFLWRFL